MVNNEDTISAIATPIGEGGISVIRISGNRAIEIADKNFRGKTSLVSVATHTAHFGQFVNSSGEQLDEVIVTIFRAPHSYTGEDVVEISCHGGILITRLILNSIIENNIRLAQPGEFTKEPFLQDALIYLRQKQLPT